MFFTADHLRGFTTFTMLKKTRFSTTVIDTLHGIPAAVKQYHPDTETWRYETERDILLELNGKWRTPRLLAGDDREKILSIEWLPGDRIFNGAIRTPIGTGHPSVNLSSCFKTTVPLKQ